MCKSESKNHNNDLIILTQIKGKWVKMNDCHQRLIDGEFYFVPCFHMLIEGECSHLHNLSASSHFLPAPFEMTLSINVMTSYSFSVAQTRAAIIRTLLYNYWVIFTQCGQITLSKASLKHLLQTLIAVTWLLMTAQEICVFVYQKYPIFIYTHDCKPSV